MDETIDFWSESRQVTEMGVSQRIRRGMVFWYDIRPDVDKTSVHRVCNGKYEGQDYKGSQCEEIHSGSTL